MSLNPKDHRPPYVQIAEAMKAAMDSGELPPGEQLPSIRQLEKQYGVAQQTVQHALRLLREEGRVVSWQGRGTFVLEPESQPSPDGSYQEVTASLAEVRKTVEQMNRRVAELESGSDGGTNEATYEEVTRILDALRAEVTRLTDRVAKLETTVEGR